MTISALLFLFLCLSLSLSSFAQTLHLTPEGAQVHLSPPTAVDNASPFGMTLCLLGPSPPPGVKIVLSDLKRVTDGTEATLTLEGDCPLGEYLSFNTAAATCSFSSGWSHVPVCLTTQCQFTFEPESSNCTLDAFYDFGTVCELNCQGLAEPKYSMCDEFGVFFDGCGVKGSLHTCGRAQYYNLGNAVNTDVFYPSFTNLGSANGNPDEVKMVAGANMNFCSVDMSNKVRCVGYNEKKMVAETGEYVSVPRLMIDLGALGETIVSFKSGIYFYSFMTDNKKVYTWGQNTYCQLMRNGKIDSSVPTPIAVPAGRTIVDHYSGYVSEMVKLDNGEFHGAGYNVYESLTPGPTEFLSSQLVNMDLPAGEEIKEVQMSTFFTAVLTASKKIFAKGKHANLQATCLSTNSNVLLEAHSSLQGNVEQFSCSYLSCGFILTTGEVMICSAKAAQPGGLSSAVPVDISSYFPCLDGEKIDTVSGFSHEALYFTGPCDRTKIFGVAGANQGHSLCRASNVAGKVETVVDSPTRIKAFVGGNPVVAIL